MTRLIRLMGPRTQLMGHRGNSFQTDETVASGKNKVLGQSGSAMKP